MKKNNEKDYERHLKDAQGEITASKNKRLDTFAKIVTLVAAFVLWLYVVATTDMTSEATFNVPIDIRGTSAIEDSGLAVQSLSYDVVSVTLSGSKTTIDKITDSEVIAYIDLAAITSPGSYDLPIKFDIPSGIAPPAAKEEVRVVIDKRSQKAFNLTKDNIDISSWVIASGCSVDFSKLSSNVGCVTVEAPSLVLSQIAEVRIVSNSTVTLSNSSNLSATIELVDKNGKLVSDSGAIIKAYSESVPVGEPVSSVSVSIPLIKEKVVELSISDKDGFISNDKITISPSRVVIKGTPEAVDKIDTLSLGSFSAKSLGADKNGTVNLALSVKTLSDGIDSVYTEAGAKYEGGLVTASVSVKVGTTYTLTLPASYVTLLGGDAAVGTESIEIKVRTTGDDTYFLLLKDRVENNEGGIELAVNLSDINLETQTTAPATIIFSSDFEGKVYEIGTYSVKVNKK